MDSAYSKQVAAQRGIVRRGSRNLGSTQVISAVYTRSHFFAGADPRTPCFFVPDFGSVCLARQ